MTCTACALPADCYCVDLAFVEWTPHAIRGEWLTCRTEAQLLLEIVWHIPAEWR